MDVIASYLAKGLGVIALCMAIYIAASTYMLYASFNMRDYDQAFWNVFWIIAMILVTIAAFMPNPIMHYAAICVALAIVLRHLM